MPANSSQRIKEILLAARGSRSQADRMIREAIARDPIFLRQLVEPFLPGIIAHALSRESSEPIGAAPKPLPSDGMDALMRGLQSRSETAHAAPQRSPHAHADTIRALAEAQRQRRDHS